MMWMKATSGGCSGLNTYSFVVLCPTIRPPDMTRRAFERLQATATHPTDWHFLDGSDGVAQTLNRGRRAHVDPARHDIYVRVDDDWYAPDNWQGELVRAFEAVTNLGLAGIDLGRDTSDHAADVMTFAGKPQHGLGVTLLEIVPPHNLAGGFHALPAHLRMVIGDMPVIGDTRYQVYGSMWLTRAVHQLGYRTAFVRTTDPAHLLVYRDSDAYKARRDEDTRTYIKAMKG